MVLEQVSMGSGVRESSSSSSSGAGSSSSGSAGSRSGWEGSASPKYTRTPRAPRQRPLINHTSSSDTEHEEGA